MVVAVVVVKKPDKAMIKRDNTPKIPGGNENQRSEDKSRQTHRGSVGRANPPNGTRQRKVF
jgi:hypothetical protein